jgi:hypothetical protein
MAKKPLALISMKLDDIKDAPKPVGDVFRDCPSCGNLVKIRGGYRQAGCNVCGWIVKL